MGTRPVWHGEEASVGTTPMWGRGRRGDDAGAGDDGAGTTPVRKTTARGRGRHGEEEVVAGRRTARGRTPARGGGPPWGGGGRRRWDEAGGRRGGHDEDGSGEGSSRDEETSRRKSKDLGRKRTMTPWTASFALEKCLVLVLCVTLWSFECFQIRRPQLDLGAYTVAMYANDDDVDRPTMEVTFTTITTHTSFSDYVAMFNQLTDDHIIWTPYSPDRVYVHAPPRPVEPVHARPCELVHTEELGARCLHGGVPRAPGDASVRFVTGGPSPMGAAVGAERPWGCLDALENVVQEDAPYDHGTYEEYIECRSAMGDARVGDLRALYDTRVALHQDSAGNQSGYGLVRREAEMRDPDCVLPYTEGAGGPTCVCARRVIHDPELYPYTGAGVCGVIRYLRATRKEMSDSLTNFYTKMMRKRK
uniref:PH01B015M02.10 protein n=1 Tax=Phyllostachys edulis TaxID=38705 RepID=L0P1R5_PHYED|nr:PH01B015M02.10 [Phyllostachys edulis]